MHKRVLRTSDSRLYMYGKSKKFNDAECQYMKQGRAGPSELRPEISGCLF